MEISLGLALPRDELTVPVARRIVDTSLRAVGVAEDCLTDVALVLTEACTNVVKHSGPGDEYLVRVTLDNTACSIDVADVGHGFDFASLSEDGAEGDAERGRGVQLMRALMDCVQFTSKPEAGSIVHLEKQLEYADDSLMAKAVAASSG